jgi:endonuclease/exonuclease/phosphatase family metal-dependent hydrolase
MVQTFAIGTFNLENLDDDLRQDVPLDRRIPVLRAQLERMDADILCLQEVNGQPGEGGIHTLRALDHLIAGTPYSGYARASTASPHGHGALGVHNLVILSRFAISRSGELHHELVPKFTIPLGSLSDGCGPTGEAHAIAWDRPALYAEIDLGEERVWILNLHLRAPIASFIAGEKLDRERWRSVRGWAAGFFLAATKRNGQALEVRLFLERLFDELPDPLIAVCGDLNSDSNEMPLRLIVGSVDDTMNPSLTRHALMACETGLPDPPDFTLLNRGRRSRYDHIAVSEALGARLVQMGTQNEGLAEAAIAEPGMRLQSSHAPAVARFAMAHPIGRDGA